MFIRVLLCTIAVFLATAVAAASPAEMKTERFFARIKHNKYALAAFLHDMPKGGDLHTHEGGATFAENLLRYGRDDGLCVDRKTYSVTNNPGCASADLLAQAITDVHFYNSLIDAWSMRHFSSGNESGHDHFFSTFGKYGLISSKHHAEILAEMSERAALQNESYLEIMVTPDGDEASKLGKQIGWNNDFSVMRERLQAQGLQTVVDDAVRSLNADEMKKNVLLNCNSSTPRAGCNVKLRYLYQVKREQAPEMVFAQLLTGFETASRDPVIVGLNMVQPEDGVISMRDYKLQMQMIQYLHQIYPNVQVSLHAGELNDALVSDDGLKFHIHDAVDIAKARRIGHGVDIMHEDQWSQLLQTMAQQQVMVEINLSSNAEILGISGKDHPLPLYIQYGVPVALSTDDEGVTRDNLTTEFIRAESSYDFSYAELKSLARNSIAFAFIPGEHLWLDTHYQQLASACRNDLLGSQHPSNECRAFLAANEKAALQWDLERRFLEFEAHF